MHEYGHPEILHVNHYLDLDLKLCLVLVPLTFGGTGEFNYFFHLKSILKYRTGGNSAKYF